MTSSGDDMRDLIRRGVERMGKRRGADVEVARLAARDPENTAKGLVLLAQREHDRLRRGLEERFGFSVTRGEAGGGLRLEFDGPGHLPRTRETAALWTDAVVRMLGYGEALRVMHHAQAYFPEPDRARMVCNAFSDAMREAPGALYGAIAEAGLGPAVREHAAAMQAAWARVYLKAFPGSKVEEALKGEDWAAELVNAAALARAERDPDAPLKRSTRFRDTLPKQADGRRQKAPGPPDLVNKVSAVLEGRDGGATKKPEPPETEAFTLAAQERMRRKARDAGLTAQQWQVFELLVSNPRITNPEIATQLGITRGHAGVVRHNVWERLGA